MLCHLRSLLAAIIAFTLLLPSVPAQDPTVAAARESKLAAGAIETLHSLADAYEAERQHATALALRREILLEYADNDEKARDKCGFTKVGDAWQPDGAKLVIDKDLTGTAKVLKKLEQETAKFRKSLLADHRAVAELWTKAGDTLRASPHWRRVLSCDPDDKVAQKALAISRFQGFRGNDDELQRLRRAWAIHGAVDWLNRTPFPVQKIENAEHPLLQKAAIAHAGYRSENFEIWGTLPGDQLPKVVQNCERALSMCRTVFGTSEGSPFVPRPRRALVMVADDASYAKVLDQCADQFDAARLHFLKTVVDSAYIQIGEQQVRFVKTNGSEDEAFDQAVRGVVQDVIGMRTDGLWEGVGHAGCGLLFGRTLTFLLEQQDARTVASWAQQLLVPDINAWKAIAAQSAWAKSDTRTSDLVLISAARFTTEQRVKAWAMCDYLFQWRPELLWELDQSQSETIRTPPEVEAEFLRRTEIPLPRIDQEWRDFWSRQEALQKAMVADPLGTAAAKDRPLRTEARAVVDAVNSLRIAGNRGAVGFYFAEEGDVQEVLSYADKLVKAEKEQQRKPKQVIPMPDRPTAIGNTLLFSRRGEAVEAVLDWWGNPAWRDALLHPGRGLLGANKNKNCFVLDLSEPVQAARTGLPELWPRNLQLGVPASARVADLGPRAVAALAARGKKPDDIVAMPWTMHFGRVMSDEDLAAVKAGVFYGGIRADGVLVMYQGGEVAGDRADGCVAYVCLQPPGAGVEVEVGWTVPARLLGEDERFEAIHFTAK